MPVATSYPGIYIEEVPNNARTISAAPTSITVFLGYTHPYKTKHFNQPVRIFSFADYEREFGGLYSHGAIPNSVAYAVYQFFLNGGSDAYVYGLEPRLGVGGPIYPQATVALGATGFTLKAIEPVSPGPNTEMTVTLSNGSGNSADITIAYGSRVEVYRGVRFSNAANDGIKDRLAGSNLVQVDGTANGTNPPASLGPVQFAYSPVPVGNVEDFGQFNVFAAGGLLDKIDIFNLMVIPGVTDNGVLSGAMAFCERKRAFLIVDVAAQTPVESIVNGPLSLPTSTNAGWYYPNLQSTDVLTSSPVLLPPSGTIAGIFARTDANRGVWKAPAGLETTLRNVTGVIPNGVMSDSQAGVLNEERAVNAIRTFPGIGTVSFGARTSVATNVAFQQWKYVPVRRMALFIEQTLQRNLGWAIFEPNDVPLWTALRTSIEAFMLSLFRQGAFQGTKPSEAFFVQCDSTTTTQTDIDNGRVIIAVGFRPLKPAEFVIVKISQLAGQVQA